MSKKSMAIIAYIFGFVAGLIFLAVEKEDQFVRKCAAQSVVFSFVFGILYSIIYIIPFIGMFFAWLVGLAAFVIWLLLIIKASQNIYYKLPVIGDFSEKYIVNLFN